MIYYNRPGVLEESQPVKNRDLSLTIWPPHATNRPDCSNTDFTSITRMLNSAYCFARADQEQVATTCRPPVATTCRQVATTCRTPVILLA